MMNMSAAKLLRDEGMHRSAVTRSYYAAYCTLTEALLNSHQHEFAHDQNNPSHEQLSKLTRNNLQLMNAESPDHIRKRIGSNLDALRKLRVIAEYAPGRTMGTSDSRDALRRAVSIFKDMEITA